MIRLTDVPVAELQPGDRCYLQGSPPTTVAGIQRLGAVVIVDFVDGTSTAPIPAHLRIDVVNREDPRDTRHRTAGEPWGAGALAQMRAEAQEDADRMDRVGYFRADIQAQHARRFGR